MKNKKSYPNRKVLQGTTAEERFKEVTGLSIEEWQDKQQKHLEQAPLWNIYQSMWRKSQLKRHYL